MDARLLLIVGAILGVVFVAAGAWASLTNHWGYGHTEAMIGAALSGIGLAFLIPACQDQQVREEVAIAWTATTAPRAEIERSLRASGQFPERLATEAHVRYEPRDGSLLIRLSSILFKGKPLLLSPKLVDGKVAWDCALPGQPGPAKWLPEECRRP